MEDIEDTTDKGSSKYNPIKKLKRHIKKAIIDVNLIPIFCGIVILLLF